LPGKKTYKYNLKTTINSKAILNKNSRNFSTTSATSELKDLKDIQM